MFVMQKSYTIGEEENIMTKALIPRPLFRSLSALDRLWHESFFDDFIPSNDFVVDITDAGDSINLKAELPGVKKEDISVDLQDGVLTLKAEKKEEIEDKGEKFIRKESRYGSMQRSFTVGDVDASNISASFTDGVLTIVLKKKESEFKKIDIQ